MAVNSFNAQNPPLTTKGDLFTFSTIPTRLAVGTTNGHVLQVDSTAATGIKWAAASGANSSFSLLNTGGTSLTGATTVTVSSLSGYDKFLVLIAGASSANANAEIFLRINSDTGANYLVSGGQINYTATYGASTFTTYTSQSEDKIPLGSVGSNAAGTVSSGITLQGGNSTGWKSFIANSGQTAGGGSGGYQTHCQGIYKASAVISSISVVSGSGNLDAGTVYIYGSVN